LKYSVNRVLLSRGGANFTDPQNATGSPLAQRLFAIDGIQAVMIGRDFVTITKSDEGNWEFVHKNSSQTNESFLQEEIPAVSEEAINVVNKGGDSEIETRIRSILDEEIRPAVAMDGGDITFERYEDGVVFLHLQGSCAGCPSSTMTLKMGIEN